MHFEDSDNADIYGETLRMNLELKKFNWGAFGFTWIWGLFNGIYAIKHTFPIVIIFCIFLPFFFTGWFRVVILCYMIYCGIKGNQWAYESARCMEYNDFVRNQKRWSVTFGIFCFIIGVVFIKHFLKF
mgnify:CR=1 FL=1